MPAVLQSVLLPQRRPAGTATAHCRGLRCHLRSPAPLSPWPSTETREYRELEINTQGISDTWQCNNAEAMETEEFYLSPIQKKSNMPEQKLQGEKQDIPLKSKAS